MVGYAVRGTQKELNLKWRGMLSGWLRGTRYAERNKCNIAHGLKNEVYSCVARLCRVMDA